MAERTLPYDYDAIAVLVALDGAALVIAGCAFMVVENSDFVEWVDVCDQ